MTRARRLSQYPGHCDRRNGEMDKEENPVPMIDVYAATGTFRRSASARLRPRTDPDDH